MARPRKKGLDYFPHDVDATTDPKLEPAIMRFGAAAYAFFFVHLEYCYRSDDLSVDVSDTETGAEMREVIQRKLHISGEEYNGILQSLLRHGAFDAEFFRQTGRLTSNGIKKRAGKVFEKREKDNKRYEGTISTTISEAETGAEIERKQAETGVETPQRIEKKSREKKSTEKEITSPPTPSEGETLTAQERRFAEFWSLYPKKVGKKAALGAWKRIKMDTALFNKIMAAVEAAKGSRQWQRDNGQYIPNPATYLNQGRWDDELEEVKAHGTGADKQHTEQNSRQSFNFDGWHIAQDDEE